MDKFKAQEFFDLSEFTHRKLFDKTVFVWEALAQLKEYLSTQKLGKHHAQTELLAYLVNPNEISIGEGTIIEPGAYIKGPCIIGRNCHIRHGAYIRGDCIIGDHAVVGHATELKHAILLNHAHASHFAYVGDSVLGNHVNLGAGVKLANLRLDGQPIIIRDKNESITTNLRKFGSMVGDFCQIGCNTVLNPGTLLWPHVQCHPNLTISGNIEAKSRIISPTKAQVKAPRM